MEKYKKLEYDSNAVRVGCIIKDYDLYEKKMRKESLGLFLLMMLMLFIGYLIGIAP